MALLFKAYVQAKGSQPQTQEKARIAPALHPQNLYGYGPWEPPNNSQEGQECSPTSPRKVTVHRTCSFRQNRRRQPWERQSSNPPSGGVGNLHVDTSPEFGNHRRSASVRVRRTASRPSSPGYLRRQFTRPEFHFSNQDLPAPEKHLNFGAASEKLHRKITKEIVKENQRAIDEHAREGKEP